MIKKYFKFFVAVFILVFCCSGATFAADPKVVDLSPLDQTPQLDVLSESLMNRIPVYLGGFAFLALLYSGAMYVLALGDTNKMEMAKKNITWTLIGILAAISVWVVIRIIIEVALKKPNF